MPKDLTQTYYEFYQRFSARYGPDTAILMQVGKFYELYDKIDPKTGQPRTPIRRATEIMNIMLKLKDMELEAGVPEQSLHKFAQTLTKEGWTVVVVDQVKDDSDQVIDRIPTRILSPGTHVEIAGQERLSAAGLWLTNSSYTASVMDLTTGEVFSYSTTHADDILHMFQVYCVKEVVWCSPPDCDRFEESLVRSLFGIRGLVQPVPPQAHVLFDSEFRREEYLRKMFRVKSLLPVRQILGLDSAQTSAQTSSQNKLMERSLCVLLRFVEDHFLQQAERLTCHKVYCPMNFMRLSNNILEQLNMITFNKQKSVLSLLERTYSALGKRCLRERVLRPITQVEELERRWEQVGFTIQLPKEKKASLEKWLKALYDMPRLHYKISEGRLEASDILQLGWTYDASSCLSKNLVNTPLACDPEIEEQIQEYRHQFQNVFDEVKAAARNEEKELCGYLTPLAGPRTHEFETKIKDLIAGWQLKWNTFCFESQIPPENFKLIKRPSDEDWIWEGPRSTLKLFAAKKSAALTNISVDSKKSGPISVTCDEFDKFTSRLRSAWINLNRTLREETAYACDSLWESVKGFHDEWVAWLGGVDCTQALASVAQELRWCKPVAGEHLKIEGLRHPLLEAAQTRMEYVEHNVELGASGAGAARGIQDPRGWLIYGVNASGKSSLMKAVGIATLLAQAGSFVPASSFTLRPYDSAFSRIWTQDNVWAGLSSFAVEVAELRDILAGAGEKSLVLGDEVCSGTESSSATALVASVLEYLDGCGAHFLFATHLHDLMNVPGLLPRPGIAVWHLRVERLPDGKLIYDRRLQPGPGSCSYGLEVARAMGLPVGVIERAHQIRRQLEGTAAANEAPVSAWNRQIQRQACEMCGHAVVRDLEVHHLHERARGGGNQLRNLAVLCETCHDRHHANELHVGPLVMTSEGLVRRGSDAMAAIAALAAPTPPDVVEAVHQQAELVLSETISTIPFYTNLSTFTEVSEISSQQRSHSISLDKVSKKTAVQALFSTEEQAVINSILAKHKGRPLKRVKLALEEAGIQITDAQLKLFSTAKHQSNL